MFVIIRNDGKYVAKTGQKHSYTTSIKQAQIFRRREEAERNCCKYNEIVVSLESVFDPTRRE